MANHNFSGRLILSSGLCLGISVVAGGCKKHAQSTIAPIAPAATTLPTIYPVKRPVAALWIDGTSYRFPPATLVLSAQGNGISATLCSDDPPTAIDSKYRGNSFMIQMKLDIPSADDIDGYNWKTVADTTADIDSNTGVFLNGTAIQLQPTSLSVTFHKRGEDLIADIEGQFQSLDSRIPGALMQSVAVSGRLYTQEVDRP